MKKQKIYSSKEEAEKKNPYVIAEFNTYHRNPTPFEIRFGEGAIHYADFNETICKKKNGDLKKWLISPYDKRRYYL